MGTLPPLTPPPGYLPPWSPESARPTSRKAVTALVLGILGIVFGWAGVPLLCAVLAIVLASLTFQEMDAADRPADGRGLAVAGLACGICALVIWGAVIVVVLATQA